MIINRKVLPNDLLKMLLLLAICIQSSFISLSAQTPNNNSNNPAAKLDTKAQKVKDEITKIGRFGEITVIDNDGKEFYGSVLEINDNSVKIHEVDLKADMEIKYERIKKIRKGYGDAKAWNGKRIPTRKHILGLVIGAAAIIAVPVIILATSKD
ncbi:MAG: hypothetical protein K1X72_21120 [Pyrinomonadaceae bacterium]|nr:hypothetical protein [Pyrinomonadaceae bacterium]